MTASKPLAVGDRVRERTVWTVERVDLIGMGFVFLGTDSGVGKIFHVADIERIDPAPPADPETNETDRARARVGMVTDEARIRTLTAERDAARAEAESLREELRQSTMTEADLAADADEYMDELRAALGAEDGQTWSAMLDEVKLLARAGLSRVCLLARAEKAEADLAKEKAKHERLVAALRENLDSYPYAMIGRSALDEIIAASEAVPCEETVEWFSDVEAARKACEGDGTREPAPEWLEHRVTEAVAESRSKLTTRSIPKTEPTPDLEVGWQHFVSREGAPDRTEAEARSVARQLSKPTTDRYPLWCHDSGDVGSESRYTGPFESEDEAMYVGHAVGDGSVRRCRKVNALSSHTKDYPDKAFIKLPEWDVYVCEGDEP